MTLNLDPKILWTFVGLVTLMCVKTYYAALIALKKGEFKWSELPRFLHTHVVPEGGGILGLAIPSLWEPRIAFIYYACAADLGIKLITEIRQRVNEYHGINLPENPVE